MLRKAGQAFLQGSLRRQGQAEPIWDALSAPAVKQIEECAVQMLSCVSVCEQRKKKMLFSHSLSLLECRLAVEGARNVSTLAGSFCFLYNGFFFTAERAGRAHSSTFDCRPLSSLAF